MNFGHRLRDLRTSRKWSQSTLAEKLKVTQGSITDYERGITMPNAEALIKIAKLFNVSIDYLVGLTNKKGNLDEEEIVKDPDLLRIVSIVRPVIDGIPVTDDQWEMINDFLESVLKQIRKHRQNENPSDR